MQQNKIEFFHDTICSFCFPMSYKMRKVQESIKDINIIHRSFALVSDPKDFDYMFQNRVQAKEEILTHWQHANQVDILHRFNIEGMRNADFLFPTSMPALIACKTAYFMGGDNMYWDVFDKLQECFFIENLNIEKDNIIFDAVKEVGLNVDEFKKLYNSDNIVKAVYNDLALAQKYNIHQVPTLIVNEKHKIVGALSVEDLISKISRAIQN